MRTFLILQGTSRILWRYASGFQRQSGCFLFGCTLLFFLCGCVAPVLPPGFIDNNPRFNYVDGKQLKVRITGDVNLLCPPDVVYIPPVKWRNIPGIAPELQEELASFLRDYVYQGLLAENYYNMIMTKDARLDAYKLLNYRIVFLEVAVTRIRKGSGLLRYFIGFGLGRSDLQIEGCLRDSKTKRDIMAFVMRYRHLGNAYQGFNPRALSGRYCLRMSIEAVALKITGIIKQIWEDAPSVGE